MALEIKNNRTRHVGLGFAVKQPKWSDEAPTRGESGHVAVASDGLTYTITLGGKEVLNLNHDDALALGIALIAETDR